MSVKVQVRTNLYLWLLTGRSNDFVNSSLNTGISYLGSKLPPEVDEMRRLLLLDDTRTDFYVIGALAAAYSSAALMRDLPDERQSIFVEDLLTLPPVTPMTSLLPRDGHALPEIDGKQAGLHGFTEVRITRQGSQALVTRDDGYQELLDYKTSEIGREPGSPGAALRLDVPGIEKHGLRASFEVDTWAGSEVVIVQVCPTRYPYQAMAGRIRKNHKAIGMMLKANTLEAFTSSSDDLRRVGAMATAIMKTALKETQTHHSEFTIEFDPEVIPSYLVEGSVNQLFAGWLPIEYDGDRVTYTAP